MSYIMYSMCDGLLNRFHGMHKCPFGSTSVRTAPLIRKDEINGPGPARYQQKMVADGERGRERGRDK